MPLKKPAMAPAWLLALADPAGDDQGLPGGVSPGAPISSPPPPSAPAQPGPAQADKRLKRAVAYLKKCEPAVSGQAGHNRTFKICCKLLHGFQLTQDEALALLKEHYNPRCQPPWSDVELQHKVTQAAAKGKANDLLSVPPAPPPQAPAPPKPQKTVSIAKATKKAVEWLWQSMIPLGKLTVLDGDPDLGKSTVLLDIAARVSTHGVMPDDTQGVTGNVLILSAEDGIEDTILPRLLAAGADLHRIEAKVEAGKDAHPPVIPADLPEIEDDLKRSDARLLVIDPLTAYLAVDTRSDQEVRRALHPLKLIAERRRCAVIYLRHLNKGTGTKAMYRGGGSIAIIGSARAGLMVAQDPDNDKRRILAQTKHNLGPAMPSLCYYLDFVHDHGVCKVTWDGTSPLKADDLLGPPQSEEAKAEKEEEQSKLEIAKEWLADFLADGPQPIKACISEAAKLGIAKMTVRRAATLVTGKPQKVNNAWYWSLKNP